MPYTDKIEPNTMRTMNDFRPVSPGWTLVMINEDGGVIDRTPLIAWATSDGWLHTHPVISGEWGEAQTWTTRDGAYRVEPS